MEMFYIKNGILRPLRIHNVGDQAATSLLIKYGADVNRINKFGFNPLIIASDGGIY